MDGKGRSIDNVFIERLWRSAKYGGGLPERSMRTGLRRVRASLKIYFRFYNERRLHENLDYTTPDEIYYANLARIDAGDRVTAMTDDSVTTRISRDAWVAGVSRNRLLELLRRSDLSGPKKNPELMPLNAADCALFKTIDEEPR